MPLIPLRDNCYGTVIERQDTQPQSMIIQPFRDKKIQHIFRVEAVGPKCRQIAVGDVAVVKEGGAVVTVHNTETHSTRQVYLINENEILAVMRNEDDADDTAAG